MRFPSDTTASDFDITGPDGSTVIAKAHVAPGPGDIGGTVRVSFTDWVEGKENVKGSIRLAARFDVSKVTTGQDNTFEVTVNGAVTPVTVKVTGLTELHDEVLSKWGGKVAGYADKAQWGVRINHKKANLTNVVITDHLSGGAGTETYIPDSFVLRRVEIDSKGITTQWFEQIDLSDKLTIAPDGKSFTLSLGNVNGTQYRLEYKTTYTPGTTLRNTMLLNSTEQSKTYTATHTSASSGGSGDGNLANKIKLIKVDADDNSVTLANAVFTVTDSDSNSFELTTGSDGTVTSGSLTSGTYKVKEKTPPKGYLLNEEEFTLNVNVSGGAIQTVTDERIKIDIPVSKSWVGPKGDSVTVKLKADGVDTGKTVTLSEDNDWKASFTGMPKYTTSGDEITYTLEEADVSGVDVDKYHVDVTGDVEHGFTITNTNKETVKVSGTKTWDDANDQDGRRPASITVNLMKDGVKVDSKTVTAADGWSYSFAGLAKYDPADGHEYAYSVAEDAVDGYTSQASGYDLTNSYTPETVSVSVSKSWVGPKADSVTVELLADGEGTGKTVTLNEGNSWKDSFDGLPKYRDHGTEIAYTVRETSVDGSNDPYVSTSTGDAASGFTITNTNTSTVNVAGGKTWNDANDQDGKRPASITVRLLRDGAEADSKEVTAADGWRWSFDGLAKYDATDGHKIAYTVTEDAVRGYATKTDGYDITNSYTPGMTSLTVTKAWDDEGNKDGSRPSSVRVQLYADGVAQGEPITLDETNHWTHTWTDLYLMNAGKDVAYTVDELDTPKGYTKTVSGNATEGYVITNAHTPKSPEVPKKEKPRKRTLLPKTGDEAGTLLVLPFAVAGATALLGAIGLGKKRS
ncbi:Cna B-type domain-containing protein [Olsenella phocaeensis]|uniref:Cna B-type domain-containing protein n=1 Tax=Olsenella phocaeensis TaxID=1852385 RepID=UPI0009300CD3|nr:Cna B-type domain-containing protein [Olsenella phocaeensis]